MRSEIQTRGDINNNQIFHKIELNTIEFFATDSTSNIPNKLNALAYEKIETNKNLKRTTFFRHFAAVSGTPCGVKNDETSIDISHHLQKNAFFMEYQFPMILFRTSYFTQIMIWVPRSLLRFCLFIAIIKFKKLYSISLPTPLETTKLIEQINCSCLHEY